MAVSMAVWLVDPSVVKLVEWWAAWLAVQKVEMMADRKVELLVVQRVV